jgi:hypothetical protein
MTSSLTITCPKCKATFDAGDAFNEHFKSTQLENDQKIKEAKKIGLEEAEKKYKVQLENQKEEVARAKKEALEIANKEIEEKYKLKFENQDAEIEKVKKDLEVKSRNDLEKQILLAKEEAFLKAKEKAEKDNREVIDKLIEEREKNIKAEQINARRIADMNQKIQDLTTQRNVELQGEAQEERIQDYLRKTFPDDDVEEIKKGAKGGDCILTINYKDKKNIAKIYFESKDTKVFQEKWADKLLSDMKEKGIANGVIIVSKSALPPDFDELGGYVERYGNTITIIPLVFPIIHVIVSKIRSILILKSRENNNYQVPQLMKKAWENLQSPNFVLPVKSMLSQIAAMETLLKKDKESFQRSSAHKDRTIKEINENIISMINSFYVNVGDIFPQDLLSNDTSLLKEDVGSIEIEKKNEIVQEPTKNVRIFNTDFSEDFMTLLKINIHKEWSLSIRTLAALKDLGITYVGDLITYTETDLLRARNFGQKSLDELKDCMKKDSLNFGTAIEDWDIIRLESSEDR